MSKENCLADNVKYSLNINISSNGSTPNFSVASNVPNKTPALCEDA